MQHEGADSSDLMASEVRAECVCLGAPLLTVVRREPIFSVDFHSSGRLATAGADSDVKVSMGDMIQWFVAFLNPPQIWQYDAESATNSFTFLSNLSRHLKTVNVVRFSPDGKVALLALSCTHACMCRRNAGLWKRWYVFNVLLALHRVCLRCFPLA